MASTFAGPEDFIELIAHEVYVDLERLRFLSFHGVPDELRGPVWHLLLPNMGHHTAMSLRRLSSQKFTRPADPSFSKLIRDAIDTYCPEEELFRRVGIRERIEKILTQYYVNHPDSFARRNPKLLVSVIGPFVYTFGKQKVECELSWFKFMQMLEYHNEPHVKQRHFSRFMTLFRTHLPQLSSRFDEEEMEPRRWVADFHRGLFATQLSSNLPCLLRLWDSYFSVGEASPSPTAAARRGGSGSGGEEAGFELHIYVCLAVLKLYEGLLLDMNYPEIRGFLDRLELDARDVPKILAQANNFRLLD